MKIILTGGGTLGSVSPLIAIWQSLKEKDKDLNPIFIGTKKGPEDKLINLYQIPFKILISGKFRRYFNLLNIIDLMKIIFAFIQSFFLLKKIKADVIISAGSYVAVPLVWASKFVKTKVILYQPDLKLGLANRLCQKQADYIFTAFPETVSQFKRKAECAGTVLRKDAQTVLSKKIKSNKILILGGGTGSQFLNELINESRNELIKKYSILHVTGKEKQSSNKTIELRDMKYEIYELLTDDYYQKIAEADLVISRAGLSTIMELSYLSKPTILIPLPDSAQEQNANYLKERNAAVILQQNSLNSALFIKEINKLMDSPEKQSNLSKNIYRIFKHGGENTISKKIYELR